MAAPYVGGLAKNNAVRLIKSSVSRIVLPVGCQRSYSNDNVSRSYDTVQNVSRLSNRLRKKIHREEKVADLQYLKRDNETKRLKVRSRQLFGRYGFESEVDPSGIWPTREEVEEIIKEDRPWFEPPLEVLMENDRKMREEKDKELKEKLERIEKNMEMMPKWIEEYNKWKETKEIQDSRIQQASIQLATDARDYFGFNISKSDPRYIKWLTEYKEKKKAEAKSRKKSKKQEIEGQE